MRLRDIDLHVEIDGDPAQPALLLLHGFTGSVRSWDLVRSALAERYLVHSSDLQVRTLLNMRRPDVHVLRLLGVRFVLTDSHLPTPGTRRVSVMPLPAPAHGG